MKLNNEIAEFITASDKVMKIKALEYASPTERNYNFIVAADFFNENFSQKFKVTPAEVGIILMAKHIVSVEDLLSGKLPLTKELIYEKCGDAYNYCLLIGDMVSNFDKETQRKIEVLKTQIVQNFCKLIERFYNESDRNNL